MRHQEGSSTHKKTAHNNKHDTGVGIIPARFGCSAVGQEILNINMKETRQVKKKKKRTRDQKTKEIRIAESE